MSKNMAEANGRNTWPTPIVSSSVKQWALQSAMDNTPACLWYPRQAIADTYTGVFITPVGMPVGRITHRHPGDEVATHLTR